MIDMPSHIKTAIERQYKLKRSLCEGRWSLVGQYISPGGEVVAIKTARKSAQGPSDLRHEIKALQVLQSSHYVVRLRNLNVTSALVMEYLPYGTLEDFLRRLSRPISDSIYWNILYSLVQIAVALSVKDIQYYDWQPSNFMFGKVDGGIHRHFPPLKLIDLGDFARGGLGAISKNGDNKLQNYTQTCNVDGVGRVMAAVARRVAEVDPARDRHLCHMSTIFSTKVSFPTLRQLINDLQVPARRDKMSMPSPDAKSIYQDFIITPALLIEKGLHVDRIHPRAIEQRFQYHFMNQLQRKERSDTV